MTQKMKMVVESIEKWRNNEIDTLLSEGFSEEYKRYYFSALLQDPILEISSDNLRIYMFQAGYSTSLIQAVCNLTKQGVQFLDKVDWALRWTPSNTRLIEELERIRNKH